jgi:hypothetical protein
MKKLYSLLLIICLAFITVKTGASDPGEKERKMPMNYLKFNVTSAVLLNNYSLHYERVITRGMTFGLGFRFMPETGIPHYGMIKDQIRGDSEEDLTWLENLTLQNYAITPELRFYTGKKKYGRGFYFSLFYRYANYEANVNIPFTPDMGDEITLVSTGNITSQTGGFMLGAQWALGKHICLDWWILGPHAGISSGSFVAKASSALYPIDQQDIGDAIEEIEIPLFSKDLEVTSDKIDLKFSGPSAGIRAGISLGFRF